MTAAECPICHGSRWKSVEVDGVERVVRCDCWRSELVDGLLRDARIDPRYQRCELSTFSLYEEPQREAHRVAKRFIDAFPIVDRGLLFHGPHGVGKTHLAVGILKEVIRSKGARGFFYETRKLLQQVRDTYNRSNPETEVGVLRPVLEAELLVLDDLGAERATDWVQETLGFVVNERYNSKKPTIFTSNLTDSEKPDHPLSFVFQIGSRTRSRLLEMCEWIPLTGADLRDPAAIQGWQKGASGSQVSLPPSALPKAAKSMARARLKDPGAAELKWPGGRAGSLK